MARPLSSPPFADSPGTWFAQFRLHANGPLASPLSPEQVGVLLGVSGTTVRRWESGNLSPRDEDLIRFGTLCHLSHHQIDFLRCAFSAFKPPFPPDASEFRANAAKQLTVRRAPMVMFDELMHARAWNSYVQVLGDQALAMLRSDRHPIEGFMDQSETNCGELPASPERLRMAIRSFWRFTAYYCGEPQYKELVSRLGERSAFRSAWTDFAVTPDSSEIEIDGVGRLLLPAELRFSMLHSFVIYPPVYHLLEFEPMDERGLATLELARRRSEPAVEFNARIHWAQPLSA